MKSKSTSFLLTSTFVAVVATTVNLQAAALTWDTSPGDDVTITPGSGTWNTVITDPGSSNIVWNDTGVDVIWSQTSSVAALNSAIFAGGDAAADTYAVTVGEDIAASDVIINNNGYRFTAVAPQTILTGAGSLIVAASGDLTIGKSLTIGSNVTFTRNNGAFNIFDITSNNASITIESGATLSNSKTASSSAQLRIAGVGSVLNVSGTFSSASTGTTGGALNVGYTSVAPIGSATVNVLTGGLMQTASGFLEIGSNSTGVVNVDGGTVKSIGGQIRVGNGNSANGSGTLNINSGTVTTSGSTATFKLGQSTGKGTVNLNGGLLAVKQVEFATPAVNTFNFNGGELRAYTSSTNFFSGVSAVCNVRDGGAKFHTNFGNNITVTAALTHSVIGGDNATDGGLTKLSSGILTLTAASTYTGPTTISGGSIQLGDGTDTRDGTISNSPTITIGNASLIYNRFGSSSYGGNITGTGSVMKTGPGTQTLTGDNDYTGATTVNDGVLAVSGGNLPDVGSLVIDGTGKVDIDTGNEEVDTLFFGATQMDAGTYGSSSSVPTPTTIDDDRFSGTGILTVASSPPVLDPYVSWADSKGLTGANNGANQDPDFDTVSNLVEFVLGGEPNPANPGANSTGLLPAVSTPGGNLAFTFTRDPQSDVPELVLTIEVGTDLLTFPDVYTVGSSPEISVDGNQVTLTLPQAPDAKKFARLNAVYTAP